MGTGTLDLQVDSKVLVEVQLPHVLWLQCHFLSSPLLLGEICETISLIIIVYFDVGSDLELSFVFLFIIYTFLKQLKVLIPTGFLKSNPATVISLTQRSCSEVGSNLAKLLKVLRESRQDSSLVLSI